MIYPIIDATKMIDRFHNVIDTNNFRRTFQSAGFIDKASLLFRQTASFNVVGIISQVNLRAMINFTANFSSLFSPKPL